MLTVKSLAFEPLAPTGELIEAGLFTSFGPIDTMSLIQIVVLGLVTLVLGLFVLRPILTSRGRSATVEQTLALPPTTDIESPGFGGPDLNVIDFGTGDFLTGEIAGGPGFDDIDSGGEGRPLDPVERLRKLIEERQAESVEILRGWMEQDEERA